MQRLLLASAAVLTAAAALSVSVEDFGAKGDGLQLNTRAINAAIMHVHRSGGGVVSLDRGQYVSGRVELLSNVELNVGAGSALNASCNPRDWTPFRVTPPNGCSGCLGGQCGGKDGSGAPPCNASGPCTQRTYGGPLVFAQGAHNIAIRGGGTLDGCGPAWWNASPPYVENRGRLVAFVRCEDVTVQDVRLANSGSFNLAPYYSSRVRADGLTINNPWDSPNTDGFDPYHSEDVSFTNSVVATGDDCVAVKAGVGPSAWRCGMPSRRIRVENVTCVHSHGLTIGSEMSGGVEDVVFSSVSLGVAYAAVRVKTALGRGGYIRNVTYEDVKADTVLSAVWIDAHYHGNTPGPAPNRTSCEPWPKCVPHVQNVSVRRVTARRQVKGLPPPFNTTYAVPDAAAITLVGLNESSLRGIRLADVSVGEYARAQECRFAEVATARGTIRPALQADEAAGCRVSVE